LRTRAEEKSAMTMAAAATPRYAARSKVTATAASPSTAAPAAIQTRLGGTAPAASAPSSSAARTVALWPNDSREVKKPIAPNRSGTPGASTSAGEARRWER
jgi:hypothetical protein